MYHPGPDDRVLEVEDIPSPEPGAPLPRLVVDEQQARLLYYVSEAWRGSRGVEGDRHVALCRFQGLSAVYLGAPNDEALPNHPLYERGLGYYGAFRVEHSAWAAALRKVGDRKSGRKTDPERTHWIITMHDETFECVADRVTVEVLSGDMPKVIAGLSAP